MTPYRGLSASPDDEVEWHCPYCDTTQPTLREIQRHITNSADGAHQGISGESPDADIVATDPTSGDTVEVYEAAAVVRPQDAALEDVSKRKQVVYAWLANQREEDADAFAAITDANRDYIIQVLGQIRRGEISRDYWADDFDEHLHDTLTQRLDDDEEAAAQSNGSNDPTPETPMSEQQELTESSAVSAKTIVINAYDLLGEDLDKEFNVSRKQVRDALADAGVFSSGYEYFRRTYKECIDGDIDDEAMADAIDERIQEEIQAVLWHAGLIDSKGELMLSDEFVANAQEEIDAQQDTEDSEKPDEDVGDLDEVVSAQALTEATTTRSTVSGSVRERLEELRERVDLLARQAEYVSDGEDKQAQFLAQEVLTELDDILDQ